MQKSIYTPIQNIIFSFHCRRAAGAGHLRPSHRFRDQAGGRVRGEQSYQEPGDAESPPHPRGHLQVRYNVFIFYRRPPISLPIGRPRLEGRRLDQSQPTSGSFWTEAEGAWLEMAQSVPRSRHLNIFN